MKLSDYIGNVPQNLYTNKPDTGNRQPQSKLYDEIDKIVAENKALKEENVILKNQNKDSLSSLESLKP